jgi:hypothetical protein
VAERRKRSLTSRVFLVLFALAGLGIGVRVFRSRRRRDER